MRCMIVDDEPMARKILREYIDDIDGMSLVHETDSPLKAMSLLSNGCVDVLFLDIQMPDINGIDFLKTLNNKPITILISAFSEYALQGYEYDVADYLLKPFSYNRFVKACNKAMSMFNDEGSSDNNNFLFIKSDNTYERILYDDILFVESADNFVYIQTKHKKYMSWLTLKNLLDDLPDAQFTKVHRSYIVANNKIDRIQQNRLVITDYEIPVSKQLKQKVMDKIIGERLLKR